MSTLVVENGTGKPTANAYISESRANALLADHPDLVAYWTAKTSAERCTAIVKATEWLDLKFRFYGRVKTRSQALQWPRTKNYDHHGVLKVAGTVFLALEKATALIAVQWVKEVDLYNVLSETGLPKSVSVEGLSVSFDSAASQAAALTGKRYPEVELLLKNLGEVKEGEFFDSKRTEISIRTVG